MCPGRTISDTVGALVNVGAISASADNDRFEAYVWSIVVRAAIDESASVTYRDPRKNVVSDLLFRTSPGSISSTAPPFTHALIQFPGKPELEAHIGIKIQGKSRVPHECDVVVLPSSEADTCRSNRMEEARRKYEEALKIFRRLAAQDPARFQPFVNKVLGNLRELGN